MNNFNSWTMSTSVAAVLCMAPVALAQAPAKTADPSSTGGPAGSMATVVCTSGVGERQHCPADTSAGVLLTKETGEMACLLGRSWGYDSAGVWVMDGCGGEFLVSQDAPETAADVTTAAAPVEDTATAAPGVPSQNCRSRPPRRPLPPSRHGECTTPARDLLSERATLESFPSAVTCCCGT